MRDWRGIEELHLSPARRGRALPKISSRLLHTIRRHGPINPVVVRKVADGHYEILSNAETWLAVQRLGQHRVPVDVLADVDDDEAADIVEAVARADTDDPLAEAQELAARLDELGGRSRWGATRRLAAMTGLSRTYISHAVRLLRLPDEAQQLLRTGQISVGHAKVLLALPDGRAQASLARRVATEGLSVRATEALARGTSVRGDNASAVAESESDPEVVRLERVLADTLGCPTRIRSAEGTLILDYGGDLDVLDGVLQRLGIREF